MDLENKQIIMEKIDDILSKIGNVQYYLEDDGVLDSDLAIFISNIQQGTWKLRERIKLIYLEEKKHGDKKREL